MPGDLSNDAGGDSRRMVSIICASDRICRAFPDRQLTCTGQPVAPAIYQRCNGEAVIVRLAIPSSHRGVAIDLQIVLFVRGDQRMPFAHWLGEVGKGAVERSAVGCDEADGAVVECLDHDVSFMHLTMVEFAQGQKVREFSLAAVRPVLDVVAVEIPSVRTAREAAAAAIPRIEGALNGRRDAA